MHLAPRMLRKRIPNLPLPLRFDEREARHDTVTTEGAEARRARGRSASEREGGEVGRSRHEEKWRAGDGGERGGAGCGVMGEIHTLGRSTPAGTRLKTV